MPSIFDKSTASARVCIALLSTAGGWFSGRNHLLLDVAAAAVFFFAGLSFPNFVASKELDQSCGQSLGVFFKSHAQAGTDYVFPYGPLGYFLTGAGLIGPSLTGAYDADLWWYSYAWAVVLSAILSLLTILAGRRIAAVDVRLLFYGVYFYFITFMEIRWMLAVLELTFLLMIYRPRFAVLCPAMLFLATISLVKFTILVYTSVGVGLLSFCWLLEARQASALFPVTLYGGAIAGLWMTLGQGIASFPTYVVNSLEITRGYSAMGLDVPDPSFKATVVVLGINALFCVMVVMQKPFKVRSAVFAFTPHYAC